MSNYCAECGAHLAGGHFCSECGQPITSDPTSGHDTTAPSAGVRQLPRSRIRRLLDHPVMTFLVVAAVATVTVLGATTLRAWTQTDAAQDAARVAQDQAQKAEQDAKKQRQQARKARQKARAKARALREQPATVVVVPTTGPPYQGPVDGGWSGTMAAGKYTFWLSVSEYGDGSLEGEMYQRNTWNGDDGTETVQGYRDGNVLYLDGVDWRHAPPSWSLDHITLTVSSDGGSVTGSYTCDTCSGTQDLNGDRT